MKKFISMLIHKSVLSLTLGLLGVLALPQYSKAGIEPINRDYIKGASVKLDTFIEVKDYYSMVDSLDQFSLVRSINRLSLEIDHDNIGECLQEQFSFWVKVRIYKMDAVGDTISDTVTLHINYNAATAIGFNDAATYLFEGSYQTKVKIIGIGGAPYNLFVKLSLEMEIERYREFNPNAIPTFTSVTLKSSTGDIEVVWPAIKGAESYDLEWTYVDNIGLTTTTKTVIVSFLDNASRVNITGTSYRLSPIYDQGYIIFRVRGVGLTGALFTHRVEGKWSSEDKDTLIPSAASNKFTENVDFYEIDYNAVHESKLNWQLIATFAEEGKKKETITYMDGLFRQRQIVTRNNTDTQAMVGEFFYDHVGRQAIQVMPTPAFDKKLKYYDDFNLNQSNDSTLKWSDYDKDSGYCNPNNPQLKTTSGASKYYSPDNPLVTLTSDPLYRNNGYIPDAKKYPYTRTLFTADPTNRVRSQGGVGPDHQIGTGHETKYFYGVPSTMELDMLFGNDVGYSEHYQKNVVIDPNGQTSISYLNLSGKIIATALAGATSINEALPSLSSQRQLYTEKFAKYNKRTKDQLTVTRTITVDEPTYYTFDYSVTAGKLTDSCDNTICYDCIYDLVISVTNSCGEEFLDGDQTTGGVQPFVRTIGKPIAELDIECDDTLRYDFASDEDLPDSVKVWLVPGDYVVTKTLSVNDSAANKYLLAYLDTLTCAKTLTDFIDEQIADIDYSGCILDCKTCESSLGTYANFKDSMIDRLNLTEGLLPTPADTMFIRTAYDLRIEYCRQMCEKDPCQAILELLDNDVQPGGQYYDSILDVTNHPEYCHYINCVNEQAAMRYKESMWEIESFDTAKKYGFLDPLGMHGVYTNDSLDPFFIGRTNLKDSAEDILNNYVRLSIGPDVFLTAWEMPVYIYRGLGLTGPSTIKTFTGANPMTSQGCASYKDLMWAAFRGAYSMMRDSLMQNKFKACYECTIPENHDRIFELPRKYKKKINDEEEEEEGGGDDDVVSGAMKRNCDTSCWSYVDYWLERMSECNIDSLVSAGKYDSLMTDLFTVCSKGCDRDNPQGASTVKPGTTSGLQPRSFAEVLVKYGIYKKNLCDTNLLDWPLPFNQSNLYLESDTLDCNNYFDSCINNTTNGRLKTMLKRIAIEQRDTSCTKCLNCEEFYDGFKKYIQIYPRRGFNTRSDYDIFENVLNRYFRFNLTSWEYLEFMTQCAGIKDSTITDSAIIQRYYLTFRTYNPLSNTYTQNLLNPDNRKNQKLKPLPKKLDDLQWVSLNAPPLPVITDTYLDTCLCRKIILADLNKGVNTLQYYAANYPASGINCDISHIDSLLSICKKAVSTEEDLSDNFNSSPRTWTQLQLQALSEEMDRIATRDGNSNGLKVSCDGLCGGATPPPIPSGKPSTTSNGSGGPPWLNLPCDSIEKYARLLFPYLSDEGWQDLLLRNDDSIFALANDIDSRFATWTPYSRNNYRNQVDAETSSNEEMDQRIIDDLRALLFACFTLNLNGDPQRSIPACDTLCFTPGPNTKRLKNYLNQLLSVPSPRLRNYLTTNGYRKVPNSFESYYYSGIYTGSSTTTLKYKISEWTNHRIRSYMRDTNRIQHRLMLEFMDKQNTYRMSYLSSIIRIYPLGTQCEGSAFRFIAKALIQDPGSANPHDTVWLYGSYDSLNLITKCGPTLCNRKALIEKIDSGDCMEGMIFTAKYYGEHRYKLYMDSLESAFMNNYYSKCMNSAIQTEKFNMKWRRRAYHYTLYYYDQAGNLIQTIPPSGVVPITDTVDLKNIDIHRTTGAVSGIFPNHTLATNYKYNTLNQLVVQNTPDAGLSRFWYDNVGRMVVSQNSEQAKVSSGQFYYSYTLYDSLSRIKEVGQIHLDTLSNLTLPASTSSIESWISPGTKDQITKTFYDRGVYSIAGLNQENLRNRVSTVTIQKTDGVDYDQGVHYCYDIHGNVNSMVREITELEIIEQNHKRIDYDYDLISGKVNNVYYQKGFDDQFSHRYVYDADNRLIQAYTSVDNVHWDRDAYYSYYLHGPLARTELGRLKVQGIDYAYTLQGWIKGVNSTTLDSTRDIGHDADTASIIISGTRNPNPNRYVAKDVFGYTLGYYHGDFSSIRSYSTTAYFDLVQNSSSYYAASPDLFNGNISKMVTAIEPFMKSGASPIGKAFKYDQLNRIVSAKVYTNSSVSGNYWNSGGSADSRWAETFSYDANGNITKLVRKGNKSDTLNMDYLEYYYESGTNKLNYVNDTVRSANYSNDIDDQSTNNYSYDAIGNLIKDTKEEIHDINWTVYGKIHSIIRTTGSEKADLSFAYTPDGHRSIKSVTLDSSFGPDRSIYIHDAQGNIMAVYTMPTVKILDTTTLDFEIINEHLLAQIGSSTFSNFIVNQIDIATLAAGAGYTDFPTDYRTAIQTASGSLEDDLLLTLNPDNFFSAHSGLINTVLTTYYTDVEVLQVLLEGNTINNVLSDIVNNEIGNTAFHNHLVTMYGSTWLAALYAEDQIAFENFYVDAMNMGGFPGMPPGPYAMMENGLLNTISSSDLYTAMATYLTAGYVISAFTNNFTSIDMNQMLTNYSGFKTAVTSLYSESDLVTWAKANDFEKLWTETLNVHNTDYILDWYQANESNEFLIKCVIIYPTFVNEVLSSTSLTMNNYLHLIKDSLGTDVFKNMCASLQELYFIPATELSVAEWHMYGSSRLGIYQTGKKLALYNDGLTTYTYDYRITYRVCGQRRFELTNHLGNVLATINDKRNAICVDEVTKVYRAVVITATDYYCFGSPMSGRVYQSDTSAEYRFSINGQEKDDEIYGKGNANFGEFWEYDTRLGRRWNLDPIVKSWESGYLVFGNNPIAFIDPDGKNIRNPYKYSEERKDLEAKEMTYNLLINVHEGKLRWLDKREYRKMSGFGRRERSTLKNLRAKEMKVDKLIKTIEIIMPNEYKYFETLTNLDGTDVNIDINLSPDDGFAGPEHTANTNILPKFSNIIYNSTNDIVDFTVVGVKRDIAITLFARGQNGSTLSNELGDIDFFFKNVNNKQTYDFWKLTGMPNDSDNPNEPYYTDPSGAGQKSRDFQDDFEKKYNAYCGSNPLNCDTGTWEVK